MPLGVEARLERSWTQHLKRHNDWEYSTENAHEAGLDSATITQQFALLSATRKIMTSLVAREAEEHVLKLTSDILIHFRDFQSTSGRDSKTRLFHRRPNQARTVLEAQYPRLTLALESRKHD